MNYNILFIVISFLIIGLIFFIFPEDKIKNHSNDKNNTLLKIEDTGDYTAEILVNEEEIKQINKEVEKVLDYQIFNIQLTDKNKIKKNVFEFNEDILVTFDYNIPNDKFIFKLDFDIEFDNFQKQDIVRSGEGNTKDSPLTFKALNYKSDAENLNLNNINIQVYKTDNYDNPVFVHSYKMNISIEKKEQEHNEVNKEEENKKVNNLEKIQNNNLKEEANNICFNILENYKYQDLKIHLPILEYCAHQGIKKAQDYIEKYYETNELINT